MTTTTETLNTAKVEAFGERLIDTLNGGALSLMISIGHRTGLFDTMATLPPSTCAQVAEAAGLNERYVREWLGAMVTGQIIDHDPAASTFSLPEEHAALLTRAAIPNNIAGTLQWIGLLGSVEDKITERFRQGGGVAYEHFCRFHEVMAEESDQTTVAGLEEFILPLVPGLSERLRGGIDVMDIGCGRGHALLAMAAMFPNSRFVGIDFSAQAIGHAKANAAEQGLSNLAFEQHDAAQLPYEAQFDLITGFDTVHDQVAPDTVLANIQRALRVGGVFLMQDIKASSHLEKNMDLPLAPFMYTISTMHCMTVSLANDGAGLGACWGEELACQMLRDAGFGEPEVHHLDHDIINSYYISVKR